jgi:imidazolonepropionase-like amidohydrolase
VIPTILTAHLALDGIRKKSPENEFLSNEDILREVRKLYDAGIPLLTGTDPPNAGINYGTDLYREMDLMSKAGIPNLEILKAATSNPSIYFNINETGYIKEGYQAHMILLDKNPIQNIKYISTINTVWKSGKKVNRE